MPKKVKAKKIQKMLPAATGLAMERAPKPSKETVIIHTTREKKRNASGLLRGGGASAMMVPLLGGVAGGAATVWATSKLNAHPLAVAAGTAAAGVAIASTAKEEWIQQAAVGAAIGAGTLGGLQLINQMKASASAPAPKPEPRGDAGDGYVTRRELQDALAKTAEKQKCDLTAAMSDVVRRAIDDSKRAPARLDQPIDPYRSSDGEDGRNYGSDYEESAYGASRNAEERDGDGAFDFYERNAYGSDDERNASDDERNASGDEYERNAYGDDAERNASDDERNASDDERNACPC